MHACTQHCISGHYAEGVLHARERSDSAHDHDLRLYTGKHLFDSLHCCKCIALHIRGIDTDIDISV